MKPLIQEPLPVSASGGFIFRGFKRLNFSLKVLPLEYRINGGGVRIIGGLEMVRYNNNRGGWNNREGVLGEIENSPFS